ncbi:MAG: 2-dehydropantoate 2-reductase [Pseudomonadales bacterium]|nr:2-dehydropantoate 2-reductase [Pseudomonadales bacterium]
MPNAFHNKSILIIGAGAVGSTIANWIAPHHSKLYVLDQGETLERIANNGVTAYLQNHQAEGVNTKVKTIGNLADIAAPDYIFLCVKNYSLAPIAKTIIEHYGKSPVIVAFQNGAENQNILPQFFDKIVYGVVCYNAWIDEPGVVGYQKHGPLVLGTPDNSLQTEMKTLQSIMGLGVETVITDHLQDAVLSKIIINLTNSFTTLVGFGYQPVDNESLFQKVLSNLTYEGTQIARKAGYAECKLGGMPSWFLIKLSANLPQFLTRGLFRKNVAKMVVSSMAQDVIANKRGDNELESINGYLLEMADKYDVKAPYNRAMYALCREAFADPNFKPISIEQAWEKIQPYLADGTVVASS